MFTGLIREFATVVSYQNYQLTLRAIYRPNIGDSIAINGACLTVVSMGADTFSVELSAESRTLLAVENLKDRVHIEPSMAIGERIEGHIVQGHIDCIGKIMSIKKNQNATDVHIKIPKEYQKFVIPKGSIAIDGVSLTVNEVQNDTFRLTIIPHTIEQTLFASYQVGRAVNIETDMFARYMYHMFGENRASDWDSVDKIMALY